MTVLAALALKICALGHLCARKTPELLKIRAFFKNGIPPTGYLMISLFPRNGLRDMIGGEWVT